MFIIVFCLYKKQIVYLCFVLFSYIVSVLILLAASGQKIGNFPAYLLNSYEVSDGYNSAMGISGPGTQVFIGVCILALFTFLLFYSILKKKENLIYFTLMNAGFVFVSFKHGLIRHDISHIYILFANALLVFCCVYITNKKQLNLLMKSLILILIFVSAVSIFKYSPRKVAPDISGKLRMIGSTLSLAADDAAGRAGVLEEAKSKIRKNIPLQDSTLRYIGNKSIDVMPSEISLAYAYDFNWAPRPVFQCYSAYTDKLDLLNSAYFEGDSAPDLLLYTIGTIDGRCPLFDAPATFRTILKNYKPIATDGKYILLQKTDSQKPSLSESSLAIESKFGEQIFIPKSKDYLFAKIYMDYNFLGKIAKLFYKPPNANIILNTDYMRHNFRFVFSPARNGLFVSRTAHTLKDLTDIWNGKIDNNLGAITVTVENPSFYNKHIKAEFFEIPK
ncbi:MAG: hypothetical protein PHQ00_05660 [Phycisphaerae bacterium]|nr:hypothetical protein [Phycisphaerae bacterium]